MGGKKVFRSISPEATVEFAKKLAAEYPNALVLLHGDLGAGKTLFAKGFTFGLGIDANVSSPSYTLMNEYRGNSTSVYHLDLYRLNCFEEVVDIGLFDILESGQPCLIEWAERVEELEKLAHLAVNISHSEYDLTEESFESREITWEWKEAKK